MKKIISLCIGLVLVSHLGFSQKSQVKIGNNPYTLNPSAALEVESTSKGFLPPRMTLVQKDAIPVSTATKGLTVYCTDCTPAGLYSYDGSAWSANATTTTSIAGGTFGAVPYQSAAGTTNFLAGNTTSTAKYLTSTGDGTTATAPTWTSFNAIPYTGATGAVNLGSYDLTVNGLTVGTGKISGTLTYPNTALGKNALSANNSGSGGNTAIGNEALKLNTTGYHNTAIGDSNLLNNTSGIYNTAIGFKTMVFSPSGTHNTSLGALSLYSISTGTKNIGIGYQAGRGFTTGTSNIFLGNTSGSLVTDYTGITTGSYNTIIGSEISGLAAGLSNNIILADGAGNIRAQHDGTAWNLKTTVKGVTELASDNSANLASTAFVKNAVTTGAPDADSATKGKIKLTNELGGTADAPTVTNAAVIEKVLTGFVSGSGVVSASDTVLEAIQKADGNVALKAPIASPTFTGTPKAITALAGTSTTQLATTEFVTKATANLKPYKVYLCTLSQSGVNNAPTLLSVFEDTVGGNFTLAYDSPGSYFMNLSNGPLFSGSRTVVFITNNNTTSSIVSATVNSTTQIRIISRDSGFSGKDGILKVAVEVRIYD